jgi:hypothetical protein
MGNQLCNEVATADDDVSSPPEETTPPSESTQSAAVPVSSTDVPPVSTPEPEDEESLPEAESAVNVAVSDDEVVAAAAAAPAAAPVAIPAAPAAAGVAAAVAAAPPPASSAQQPSPTTDVTTTTTTTTVADAPPADALVAAPEEESTTHKYMAPDGRGFQNRTAYRKYLFATFYSFSEREGEFLCKVGGDIDGQAFNLSRLTDCEVQLLDHSDQVLADYLQGCRVFIGPSAGSVFLRNCENCVITIACKQLRTRDCKNCRFYVYSKTEPVIEMTEDVEVRRFNGSYEGMDAHFRAANLDRMVDNWSKIHDFSKRDKDLGPEPHYTLIKSAPAPWNATGERETERPRLTSETSVSMC